ncbi:hypothetical protein [Calothrix sp. UHCC 0171]|uniref:hypothetical protein n=1 Tax=Calothrix sp. UHCC 0171 TaxID=3110245 RepID=UPI002B21A32D|nr:hypothetical protein [Calothrix sp. UHCC 0171]MEA5572714.1 hypothetical protein [Calothrix sp. UHCC 0171]
MLNPMRKQNFSLVSCSLLLVVGTLTNNYFSPRVLAKNPSFDGDNVEHWQVNQNRLRNLNLQELQRNQNQQEHQWQEFNRKLQEQRDRQWQNNKRQWQEYNRKLQQRDRTTPNPEYQWQDQNPQWENYHQ